MQSRRKRQILLGTAGGAFTAVIAYRLFNPTDYSMLVTAGLLVLTALIAASIEGSRIENHHWIALTQKKSYAISWRSAILTTMITGLVMLILLYAAAFIVGLMSYAIGGPTMTSAVLIDIINRVELLNNLHAIEITLVYITASAFLASGFWLLYPYLPTKNEEVAASATFMIAAAYGAGIFYLLLPQYVYIDHIIHFALDAALIATWGKFFAEAYEWVEAHLL